MPEGSLSHSYDALVTSWISSLSRRVPGRFRTVVERVIRPVAAGLQLASYGLRVQPEVHQQQQQETHDVLYEDRTAFTLAFRGAPTFADDSRRVKTKAIQQASAHFELPQALQEQNSIAAANLPTPEPTPSVRSKSTQSEAEDPATQRLRALAEIASQPPMPHNVMGILSHWSTGQNPEDYDWEACKARYERGDKIDEAEERVRAKKRRRKEYFTKQKVDNTVASLSQSFPPRVTASQVDPPSHQQYSSQAVMGPASQPLPSPYRKSTKNERKAGF